MLQGLELHRRMASLDTGAADCLWMADVYVRMSTGKVVHIGPIPPDAILGTADVQQIDMVRLKDGATRFSKDDAWDNAKVDLVIDIKASVRGRLKPNQEVRLQQLAGDPEKLATCRPYRLYRNGAWGYNDQWGLNWRVYTLMGLALVAAGDAAQLVIQGMADDLDALSSHANDVMQRMTPRWGVNRNQTWYSLSSDNRSQKLTHVEALLGLMNEFLSNFAVGDAGDALDIITIAELYRIMDEYLREVAPNA